MSTEDRLDELERYYEFTIWSLELDCNICEICGIPENGDE